MASLLGLYASSYFNKTVTL